MTGFTELDITRAKSAIAMFKKASFTSLQFGECVAVTQTMIWLEQLVLGGMDELKKSKEKATAEAILAQAMPLESPFDEPMKSVVKEKKKKK